MSDELTDAVKSMPPIEKMEWLKDRFEERQIVEVVFREGSLHNEYLMAVTFNDGVRATLAVNDVMADRNTGGSIFNELMTGLDRKLFESSKDRHKSVDLFVARKDIDSTRQRWIAFNVVKDARNRGYSAVMDSCGRSLKGQLKYANKIGASYTLIVSEYGSLQLKDMATGEQKEINPVLKGRDE